ncbi:MAG TPA: purine-nucleoside phosphorylase [Clostridiales bacterium]|nr:purine-nucleoside phosphorylase [Clostridiales bacterium]
MKNKMQSRLDKCLKQIRKRTDFVPKIALVLGSGLGRFAESVNIEATISYNELDGSPVSTVEGHTGRFVLGYIDDIPLIIMQGRVHYYEGYTMEDVVLPIRLMRLMGAEVLFVTNASGGINENFAAGDFMLIDDHISLFIPSPLIGQNLDKLGTRFPDMTQAYDAELKKAILDAATQLNQDIKRGVYVQLTGPAYETPAEIRALRALGADAVGMSTVCEVIAARHCGMRVCGISCVSNAAAGLSADLLSHEDVQKAMSLAGERIQSLLNQSIKNIWEIIN